MKMWCVSKKVKNGKAHVVDFNRDTPRTACGQNHIAKNLREATKEDEVCSKCLWLENENAP